jgi:hypothetical protein
VHPGRTEENGENAAGLTFRVVGLGCKLARVVDDHLQPARRGVGRGRGLLRHRLGRRREAERRLDPAEGDGGEARALEPAAGGRRAVGGSN